MPGEKGVLKRVLRVSVSFLLVLVLGGLFSRSVFVVRGTDDAVSSVGEADAAVRGAFNATLNAEKAAANVSGLILRLNEAGGLLDEAEVALANGNSTEASSKAGQCIGIAESVKSDADALKASALDQARTVFWTYLTFSVVSSAAFVVALALVWRRFKRGNIRKVLGMRPEVAVDEA
jgi:hypothetical protein